MTLHKFKLMAASLVLVLIPGMALALDANDFATKLSNSLDYNTGFNLSFVDAQADGSSVILTGIAVDGLSSKADELLAGARITFSNVVETGDGGYTADQAVFDDILVDQDDVTVSVKNISISDIQVFADPGSDVLSSMLLYKGFHLGPVSVAVKGKEMFRLQSADSVLETNNDNSVFEGGFAMRDIHFALDKIDDKQAEMVLGMLQLTSLDALVSGKYVWDTKSGDMSINNLALDVKQIGRLSMSLSVGGYTLDLVQKLQDMARQTRDLKPGSSEANLAEIQLITAMSDELSIKNASVRFDDAGITNALLDFVSQTQGLSKDELISSYSQMNPSILWALGSEELQAKALREILKYLKDPQNIEISASPEEPVPFIALMSISQNPNIADSLLNLDIVANQPQ